MLDTILWKKLCKNSLIHSNFKRNVTAKYALKILLLTIMIGLSINSFRIIIYFNKFFINNDLGYGTFFIVIMCVVNVSNLICVVMINKFMIVDTLHIQERSIIKIKDNYLGLQIIHGKLKLINNIKEYHILLSDIYRIEKENTKIIFKQYFSEDITIENNFSLSIDSVIDELNLKIKESKELKKINSNSTLKKYSVPLEFIKGRSVEKVVGRE